MDVVAPILAICIIGLSVVLKIWLSSPQNIGKLGEKRVASKLDWLPKEYITLNDILLPTNYGTTQIDHIVVSPYGIFVIETKNYKGWIFGHENSEEWKQSLLGKKRFWGWTSEQHKLRNPIRQNAAHVRAVKAILKEIGDFAIIPIVIFEFLFRSCSKSLNSVSFSKFYKIRSKVKCCLAVMFLIEQILPLANHSQSSVV